MHYLLTLEAIERENEQPDSLTNFVGISIDWAAFLFAKFVTSFAVFSFVEVWKNNGELVPYDF